MTPSKRKTAQKSPGPVFGAHESIAGGIYTAIERGQTATCDTIQLFNKSNSQWKAKKLTDEEIERYFELQQETGITVTCSHSSYLINIASPNPDLNEKSFLSLKEEVERCNRLKIPNLVFHPGSHVGSGQDAGLKAIILNINRLFDQVKGNTVTLCLETTAGQGSNLGYSFEHLAEIIDGAEDKDHVGVCMDSCHVFAAGYPISEAGDYKKTIKAFDSIIGLDRLRVLHLNDSKKPLGSKRDRHEHIGKGEIGIEGFRNIVNDRRLRNVPMIIETPKGDDLKEDRENLKLLRSLVKKPSRKRAF